MIPRFKLSWLDSGVLATERSYDICMPLLNFSRMGCTTHFLSLLFAFKIVFSYCVVQMPWLLRTTVAIMLMSAYFVVRLPWLPRTTILKVNAMKCFHTCCSDAVVAKDYCNIELTANAMKAFVYAIKNHYWYQMYIGESDVNGHIFMWNG